MNENQHFSEFPLMDALDIEILMHRDVHFGGLFSMMIDYYQNGGRGVQPEYELERILFLAETEKKFNQNLAPLLLTGVDAEKVANAKEAYKKLRDVFELSKTTIPYPKLIAELILAESADPVKEIEGIVAHQEKMIPYLIDLITNDDFKDPLFPGYGEAPKFAAKCLGRIAHAKGIIPLFEMIGHSNFEAEEQALQALKTIGEPAKEFLLKVVSSKPLNEDNERAALALIEFKEDEKVASRCFSLLKENLKNKFPCLISYLTLVCEGLKNQEEREAFASLMNDPSLPPLIRQDMKQIVTMWNHSLT